MVQLSLLNRPGPVRVAWVIMSVPCPCPVRATALAQSVIARVLPQLRPGTVRPAPAAPRSPRSAKTDWCVCESGGRRCRSIKLSARCWRRGRGWSSWSALLTHERCRCDVAAAARTISQDRFTPFQALQADGALCDAPIPASQRAPRGLLPCWVAEAATYVLSYKPRLPGLPTPLQYS